jgi:hypothetical protein
MQRKTRKTLEGAHCKWEPVEPFEGGYGIEGTRYGRGSRVTVGTDTHGIVLGVSDSEKWIGVKFEDSEHVTEYTPEQFASRFGG